MIAYVPYEAASDGRLTSAAKSLLLYLSDKDGPPKKKWYREWCWESLSEIATALSDTYMHYTPKMIRDARHLLLTCGYLERRTKVFLQEVRGKGIVEVHHFCYRVVVFLEQSQATNCSA